LREINDDELVSHSTDKSCWMAIDGLVYDITDFLSQHPGGKAILLKHSGRDATKAFKSYHPLSMLQLLDKGSVHGRYIGANQGEVHEASLSDSDNIPLGHILNSHDFARSARKRVSKEAWDYLISAAEDEVSYRENELSFSKVWIKPRVLIDVSGPIDTSVSLFGFKSSSPIYISATAMGRLYHPDGEVELCRGARRAGIVQMCPTLASCSMEEMSSARAPGQSQWYQLYANTDQSLTEKIIVNAEMQGFTALVVTVDVAVLGKRERDQRNKVSDISNVQKLNGGSVDKSQGVSRSLSSFVSPSLTWGAIRRFKRITKLPIILKGIQTKQDAILAAKSGLVRGIIISNHGGRQVDFSRPTVDCLIEIMHALKKEPTSKVNENFDVYVDGGIRRGSDVFKCLALGAKAVGIGRPAMFALSSHGSEGVHHLIDILTEELRVCMMHTGCRSLVDINEKLITVVHSQSASRYPQGDHESRL
jgi:L-lactate dehydrogenase (cytochrome)